jgi:hypothetical protein
MTFIVVWIAVLHVHCPNLKFLEQWGLAPTKYYAVLKLSEMVQEKLWLKQQYVIVNWVNCHGVLSSQKAIGCNKGDDLKTEHDFDLFKAALSGLPSSDEFCNKHIIGMILNRCLGTIWIKTSIRLKDPPNTYRVAKPVWDWDTLWVWFYIFAHFVLYIILGRRPVVHTHEVSLVLGSIS